MSGEQDPHTNGVNGEASDDEDDQKNMRPVDIEADVNEMERRKRVQAIMNSKVRRIPGGREEKIIDIIFFLI